MSLYTADLLHAAEKEFAEKYSLPKVHLHLLHSIRKHLAENITSDWRRLAVWIVAPVLAVFTRWLAEQISKYPSSQNLVIMREGRLIGKLLERLYCIPTKEIWINRDVSMRAAFGCGDDEALLNWLVRTRIKPLTTAEAANQLTGMAINQESKSLLLIKDAEQLLLDWKKKGLLEIVQTRAISLAERFISYWQNVTTVSNKTPILLMDFACVGNIQRSLQSIFAAKKCTTAMIGLNFLTTAGSIWAKKAGCEFYGCLANDGNPSWIAEAYARTPELIEIFAAATDGPLHNYADDGKPICGPSFLNTKQQELITETQNAIIDAADVYNREFDTHLDSDLGRCIWGRILLQPISTEAEIMGDWQLDGGINGISIRRLAPRLIGKPSQWSKIESAWPAGSLARNK